MRFILIILACLVGFSCFGQFNEQMTFNQNPKPVASSPVDYKTVVLADSPNHLWLFNDASGQVTDYAGSANLSIPSGLTLGASGLLGSQGYTSGIDDGTANLHSSGNINDFDYNDSYSYEFVFEQTNSRSGTQSQYVLATKLANSGTFDGYEINMSYNVASVISAKTADGLSIPATWMTMQFYESDVAGHFYTAFACCDITNGVPTHVITTYNFSNSVPDFRVYVNGNAIQMTFFTNAAMSSIKSSRPLWLLARTNNAVSAFTGKIQAIASYTNMLTEQQILNHYLAFQSQYYYSNQFLYSSYKGTATDGTPLRISAGTTLPVASSNAYYIYGTGFSGLDFISGGDADQYAVSNITAYVSTNLYRGTFAKAGSAGIAFTATNIPNLWGNIRPQVVFNPNTSKYVSWTRMTTNVLFATSSYLITESSNPSGPFTIVTSNYMPNAASFVADATTFVDSGGAGYLIYGDNAHTYVSALASDYHSTVGSAIEVTSAVNLEGYVMFRRGNYYFLIAGTEEYYNSMRQTDVYYMVSTNPTNGFSSAVSVYAANPLGSGYDGQTTSGVFQLLSNTNRYIASLDYWNNGYLNRSTVNYMEITFPTTNTLVFNPGKEIALP